MYLMAMMNNDLDTIQFIESQSALEGYGPTAPCVRTENISSTRKYCRESITWFATH